MADAIPVIPEATEKAPEEVKQEATEKAPKKAPKKAASAAVSDEAKELLTAQAEEVEDYKKGVKLQNHNAVRQDF